MKKNSAIAICFLLLLGFGSYAQTRNPLSLSVSPGADIPLGPLSSKGEKLYTFGGSAALEGEYSLPFASFLSIDGLISYCLIATPAQNSLSLISLGVGAGLKLMPLPKFELKLSALGGYSLTLFDGKTGGRPFVQAGAKISYALGPALSMGIGGTYKLNFGLYSGIGITLGASFHLGAGRGRSRIEFVEPRFDPVFPVFYQYYDQNPLGGVTIRNHENGVIRDVTVSFYVAQYMERPKLCAEIDMMKKGDEIQVPLYALFSDDILNITEGTKVTAQILVDYTYLESELSAETSKAIQMYHRNAMIWDDDQKAASYVTARDPEVLRFSKGIAGEIRNVGSQAISSKFREAVALFEALKQYGINYVVDPTSPYAEFSENKFALDYLQFPIQTISYKAGDCDDLSILYSALLESIGVETAFITVPGHIYMAFCPGIAPEKARKTFYRPEDLIFHDEKTWIPIETTAIPEGFLKAWQLGAKQWRAHSSGGTAALLPIHTAWKIYPPVGVTGVNVTIESIKRYDVIQSYKRELDKIIKREISAKVSNLQKRIEERPDNPGNINKLGILYARFGLYDNARAEFEKVAKIQYTPALINLGNLAFVEKDYHGALKYYENAHKANPDNVSILIGMAKANYELENYSAVASAYERGKELNPKLAERYSYLVASEEETSRASSVIREEDVLWDEK
jgi:Tfp pilus assembly protein PilF